MNQPAKKIIFSGMRPTGALHLGNYVGALRNWVRLQDAYDCYFCIVNWHALSSEYHDARAIRGFEFEVAVDWLSAGLDPERAVLFLQADVKEHAELHLILSMITPLPWVERIPTFKEQLVQLAEKDLNTYGFLGYPVLQAADIALYRADAVPVGEDQAAHIELAREIIRRFNRYYGDVFPEPRTLLTEVPRLAGTDGRKMSKSYGNAIELKDSAETVRAKIMPMVTDTRRKRRSDPGEPNDCPVFTLHKAFVPKDKQAEIAVGCRTAGIGCRDCKAVLLEHMVLDLQPIWEKRARFEQNPGLIRDILEAGSARARARALETMVQVRAALGF
ncbi:MAG: tryptophan--tRNA ligase [Acidobacteriota bacterium]|nr:tryptophan--tRNA ligase [Acidobacteriota bacterium]